MPNWQELLRRASLDKDELKKRLPLEFVVTQAGVALQPSIDGRLVGLCPFHEDTDPSFAIFGDHHERVGCWSCDFGNGDVFDFIERWRGLDFSHAIEEALKLLTAYEQSDWKPSPEPAPQREIPQEELANLARTAYVHASTDLTAIQRLLDAKNLEIPARWLHETFLVGVLDDITVLMPHLTAARNLTGYKTRVGPNNPMSAHGSRYTSLYNEWNDRGTPRVILCEGESDTWRTAWEFQYTHDVLGLPAGASQYPKEEWVKRLAKREVTILFDGDDAGRRAARNWWEALHEVAFVRIAGLEDGADACTTGDLRAAVEQALTVPQYNSWVVVNNERYERGGTNVPVCNWFINPARLLTKDGDWFAIEGWLPGGEWVTITAHDLATEGAAVNWSNHHGYSWSGTRKDAQGILELLQHTGPFLARGKATDIVGWHEGHFVLPHMTFGPQHYVYVPPPTDIKLENSLHIENTDWDPAIILELLQLHAPEVISPILAWLAAAPLRATTKYFPILVVTGGSGYGKTTLLEEVLETFGWRIKVGLSVGTTPHGVRSHVQATNAVPVWFDEYRAGINPDVRQELEAALRSAWDGTPAVRGGMNAANLSQTTTVFARAPIIVSGESTVVETSHVERTVIVALPPAGRSEDALARLRHSRRSGFGYAFLWWLTDAHRRGVLPACQEAGGRVAAAHNTLSWGWEILNDFTSTFLNGYTLPELDMSRVKQALEVREDPYIDAIVWGMEQFDRWGASVAWVEEPYMYVRVRELIVSVNRDKVIPLPGNEAAMTQWLVDRYNGVHTRIKNRNVLRIDTPPEVRQILQEDPAVPI